MECTVTRLLKDGDRVARRASATGARAASSSLFKAKAVVLATGGIGKALEDHLELLGVHRRRPGAGALGRRRPDRHGVRPVPPDRHGLAAQRARHPGHRGRPRRRRHAPEQRRRALHVRLHPRVLHAPRPPTPRRRPTRWYERQDERPPHARPAPARRGRPRHQRRGEGRPRHARTAACSSTSPRAAPPRTSSSSCPSMYHQFKELADVDITKEPMEVGPTCHYMMGGVRVDPETHGATRARACSPPASAPAACTARTAWAATRSPTCSSSAGAPGSHAAEYAQALTGAPDGRRGAGRRATRREALDAVRPRRRREPVHDPRGPPGR